MFKFVAKRVLHTLPTLLIITMISYGIMVLAPGDTVTYIMGPEYNEAKAKIIRHAYGLDKPVPVRYALWLGNMLKGDMGTSNFFEGMPVATAIRELLPYTLALNGLALLLSFVIAMGIAVVCAMKQNSIVDRFLSFIGVIGQGIPEFWIANLIIVLNYSNPAMFPYIGLHMRPELMDFKQKLMSIPVPMVIITIVYVSRNIKYIRSAMIEALQGEHIMVARSKGLKERTVVLKHALKNAMIPILTAFNLSIASLISTSVIIETIFRFPGIGNVFVHANYARDYPILMGIMLVTALIVVAGSLLTDIAYTIVDPRIKYE